MKEEHVELSVNGEPVRGMLHTPSETPAELVIIVHGWSGEKTGPSRFFVRAARRFAEEGYAVLRFDFRGSGDSDREFEEQTISSMLDDLNAVVSEAEEMEEVDDQGIALAGHSQGGYISLLHAAQDDRVNALLLWMARTSDNEDWFSDPWKDELERKGYYYYHDHKQTQEYYEDGLQYDSEAAIEELEVPIGMIYGGVDESVPPSEGKRVADNAETAVEFEIFEGLDHVFRGEQNKEEVIEQSLEWLDSWL